MNSPIFKAFALAATMSVAVSVSAQQVASIGFKSVGRAAPLAADIYKSEITGAAIPFTFDPAVGAASVKFGAFVGAARDGKVPPGTTALSVDLYTTQDFYQDKA